jgi:hypothetical protein
MSLTTFQIKAKGDAGYGNMEFIVGAGTTTAMTIDYTGLVNIATLALGDVGHGTGWPGIANTTSASSTGYAIIQNVNGETLVNCQSGQKIGFREANSEKMTIKGGNVGIGNSNPSKKLEVNGTFSASGSSGFSGMVCSFVGERNGTATPTHTYAYGNGSSDSHGATMPVAGTVIAITFSASASCSCRIELFKNNSATGKVLQVGSWSPPPQGSGWINSNNGRTTSVNQAFSAGNRLSLKLVGTDSGTVSNSVATFFVKYT